MLDTDFRKSAPVVLCERFWTRDGHGRRFEGWKFWCEHCKREHHHSPEAGHRVAHCFDRSSPYDRTGYILELKENADG